MGETLIDAASFLLALVGMEFVAWTMHRYVMHGWLWSVHRSHHDRGRGKFELNDLFGVGFAALAVGLFLVGARPGWSPAWWFGAGMTTYGLLYALVHDGLVHRRWPLPIKADRGYLGRLARAHHLHHTTRERDGGVSYGFLFAPDPSKLMAELRRRGARGL